MRPYGKRVGSSPCLLADDRGAQLVEYLMLVGLVALVAMGGWRIFGARVGDKASAQARCVETFECSAGAPAAVLGAAAPDARSSGDKGRPNYDDVGNESLRDAEWKPVPGGKLTIEEPGEANAFDHTDVVQGGLADCYFAASLAEIARQKPELLRQNIKDNGDGTFTVTFYEKSNVWSEDRRKVEVTVDGQLPTKNGHPVFMKNEDSSAPETWPQIYEKAYAQWKGGYENIEYDKQEVAIADLTGRKSSVAPNLWQSTWGWEPKLSDFADAFERGDAVMLSTKDDKDAGELFQNGTLWTNHVYAVIAVDREKREVTLRDPQGRDKVVKEEDFREHFDKLTVTPLD